MEKQLRSGETLIFETDSHYLELFLFEGMGRSQFMIMFNGVCVHSSKTFKSAERKLNELVDEYNLKQTENVQS